MKRRGVSMLDAYYDTAYDEARLAREQMVNSREQGYVGFQAITRDR